MDLKGIVHSGVRRVTDTVTCSDAHHGLLTELWIVLFHQRSRLKSFFFGDVAASLNNNA
jgi:hypothetical protein